MVGNLNHSGVASGRVSHVRVSVEVWKSEAGCHQTVMLRHVT